MFNPWVRVVKPRPFGELSRNTCGRNLCIGRKRQDRVFIYFFLENLYKIKGWNLNRTRKEFEFTKSFPGYFITWESLTVLMWGILWSVSSLSSLHFTDVYFNTLDTWLVAYKDFPRYFVRFNNISIYLFRGKSQLANMKEFLFNKNDPKTISFWIFDIYKKDLCSNDSRSSVR